MDELEVNEAPEEPAGEPEPTPEPEELTPEPEEPALEPEEPEEPSGETGPEAPDGEPVETGTVSGETVQDLISAIDDLNETITGAVTEEETERPSAEEEEGSGSIGGGDTAGFTSVDLAPVVTILERTTELLEQQNDILLTQHNDLLQVQANLDFVFLAVCMLAGVAIGSALGFIFDRMWRG